ncbi:MAG: DivIVA domain-containing protein, partial [Terriglobales bacterium]
MERGQRFKRRALRRGYKVDEVDDFLDRVEGTLAGEDIDDPIGPDEVRDVIFKTRWGGYDEWHVDMELDRLERQLEELIDDPAAVRGSSGFRALGHRKSLALPAGSSGEVHENEPAEPGVYRSSATGDDLSFADLTETQRHSRVPTQESVSHNEAPNHRGVPAPSSGAPARSRPAPSPIVPPPPAPARPRSRNVTPRPTPSPVADTAWPAAQDPGTTLGGRLDTTMMQPRSAPRAAQGLPAGGRDPYAGRHGKTEMTVEVPTYGGDVSPFTHEDAQRLMDLKQSFKLRRFGSGYEPSQVDRLWDAIAAAMDGQASAKVNDSDFDPRQFALVQGGYFEQEVDSALGEMRDL